MPEQANVNFSNRNKNSTDGIENATSYTMEDLLRMKGEQQSGYTDDTETGFTPDSGTGFSDVNDETPSFSRNDLSAQQSIKVNDTTTYDAQGNVTGRSVVKNYTEVPKAPKTFLYGSGNITAKQYAENIWGKKTTQEDVEAIARIFADKFDSEADISSYKVNTENTAKAKLVGQYIGERGGKYSKSYVNKLGGSITGNINEGILFGKELAEKDRKIKEFASEIDKNMREEIRTNVENGKVEEILDKLDNNRTLNPQEMETFKKAKATYDKAHEQFINKRDELGFSQEENIYADYKNSDIKTSARFRNKVGNNVTYQSLKRNQRLLDYNIETNDNGTEYITGHKGDYANSFKVEEPITDFLAEANNIRDLDDANRLLVEDNLSNADALKYMNDNNAATFSDSNAERIVKLRNAGVDVENSDDILKGYMSAHHGNVDSGSEAITYLNKASEQAVKDINISDDNIQYINGNGLSLTNTDGKFSISQESINLMDDDMKAKYKTLIDSNDIGMEDLTDINKDLDIRYRENQVTHKINSDEIIKNNSDYIDNEVNNRTSNVGDFLTDDVVQSVRSDVEKEFLNNNYNQNTSFDDIRKGASSNYDRITGSYAPKTGFGGVALSDDEVLKRSGVEEEALRKEILNAKNFDELSPEAMGALYKANQTVSDSEVLIGKVNLSIEDIDGIAKWNPKLSEDLKKLSAEDQRKLLGEQLGIGRDGLRGRLDISMRTGLDLNDPKVARDIMEKLGGEDAVKHMGEILNFTGNKNGYGDFGNGQAMDVIEAARKGNLQDAARKGRVGQMYTAVSQILDEIKSKHGEDFGKEYGNFEETFNIVKDKFDPEKLKKQSKDFTDAEKEAFDNVIDTGISATSERAKELGKGFKRADGKIGGITKFFGNNGGKFAGAALGIGAIFGVAAMASNASEERERKRQEMNQLLAAQSANIRGGY